MFTSMFKSNYDYFLQLSSLDFAFLTLQVLVHLDNETTRLYLDKASQKPRLCNDGTGEDITCEKFSECF